MGMQTWQAFAPSGTGGKSWEGNLALWALGQFHLGQVQVKQDKFPLSLREAVRPREPL